MLKRRDKVEVVDSQGNPAAGELYAVWERLSNVPWDTVRTRLRRGWSVQKALFEPSNTALAGLSKCGLCGHMNFGNAHSCEECDIRTDAGKAADERKRLKHGR